MTRPAEVIPEHIRAPLHARFPNAARWAPPEPETPWSIIRDVIAQARRDALNDRQEAAAVYSVLVAKGVISEGRA